MSFEFQLPDIGEGLTEAEIVAWLVSEGDVVTVDQPIVEVETAKTTVEIPAPRAGTIVRTVGDPGDTVEVGDVLFVIGAAGDVQPAATIETSPDQPTAPVGSTARTDAVPLAADRAADRAGTGVRAMPIVRKLARERGVDLAAIDGSGPGGAITRADVEAAAVATEPASTVEMARVRRRIAEHMTESWTTIPHVTVQAEVRAEHLLADRTLRPDRPLPLEALVAHAVVPLLRRYPEFNAAVSEGAVEYRGGIHLGFAVDTDAGLMVAVIRDAEGADLLGLADDFDRLSRAAIDGTITPSEATGQTFTISNIGALGGGHGTPIIPLGTSAIMSIGRATEQPVVEGGELAVGLVAPLDLSYDHRLIDGGLGQRFLADLVRALESPVADRT